MSDETFDRARRALSHRSLVAPVLGVVASAAVLIAIAWGVAGWLGLPRSLPGYAVAAVAFFAVLEVRVQRDRSRQLAPARALFDALIASTSAPRAGSLGGLPWVGGRLPGAEVRWTAHLEWEGAERLRLAVIVESGCGVALWLCARDLDEQPARLVRRLRARHAHRDVPGLPPTLLGLAPDPIAAAERWAVDAALREEAEALVRLAAPFAAALDLRSDAIGWDARLDERWSAEVVVALAGRLAALAAHTRSDGMHGLSPGAFRRPDAEGLPG